MDILIAIPTYNEAKIISKKIDELFAFCQKELINYQWVVVIADNGSQDETIKIVHKKSLIYPNLKYFHIKNPSKGLAIKKAWQEYTAEINIFMDADLSTELKSIHNLIEGINNEKFDLVIGSRYKKKSKLKRGFLRSLISNSYNFILRLIFNVKISDIQCGFKAASRKLVKENIPKIKNNGLFFDTELVILTNYHKLPIKEIAVNWYDSLRKSKIHVLKTSLDYFKNSIKLKLRLLFKLLD